MSEKFKANIDHILIKLAKKHSLNLGDKDVLPFSDDLVEKGHYVKFAFDLYKVDNDPYRDLWLLDEVNGKKHLIRASDPVYASKQSGDWEAISDYDRSNVTLKYKNIPITNFSSDTFGFNKDDITTFKQAILEKVEGDEGFVRNVFSEQPKMKVESLLSMFPELTKYIQG